MNAIHIYLRVDMFVKKQFFMLPIFPHSTDFFFIIWVSSCKVAWLSTVSLIVCCVSKSHNLSWGWLDNIFYQAFLAPRLFRQHLQPSFLSVSAFVILKNSCWELKNYKYSKKHQRTRLIWVKSQHLIKVLSTVEICRWK